MTTPTIDEVRQQLTEIPELAAWLPRALTTRHSNGSGGGHGILHSPAPYPLEANRLADTRPTFNWRWGMFWCPPSSIGALPFLRGWCLDLAHRTPPANPKLWDLDIPQACLWLQQRLDTVHDDLPNLWPALARGVQTLHHDLTEATRQVRPTQPDPVMCPACHETPLAGADPQTWTCPLCAHQIQINAVTLPEAARTTGEGLRTLQRWAKAGKFARVEKDGQRLYDLASIQAEIARRRLTAALRPPDGPTAPGPDPDTPAAR